MADVTRLPSFVVIGAVKAATTWINAQLQDHPDVFMPGPEPHYFSTCFDRGIEYYESYFSGAEEGKLIGEKSADYFSHPLAAERIAALLPAARLVLQLRNPVDRAYSDYKMLYRRGTISGPPEQYLTPQSKCPRLLEYGRYAHHLRRWQGHFDPEQFKIILYDDIMSSPREVVRTVCSHIGARPFYSDAVGARAVNDASAPLLPLAMRRWLSPLKPLAVPFRNAPGFQQVRSLVAREMGYPPLNPETRARLIDYFGEDIEQLASAISRNLDHWLARDSVAA